MLPPITLALTTVMLLAANHKHLVSLLANNAAVKHEYNRNYLLHSTFMKSSVCLHSGKSQYLLRDLGLLKRLGAVVRILFAVADGHTGFANVAV